MINSIPKAVNIFLIGIKDERLIVHHLYKGKSIYHIITKSGQLIKTIESKTQFLISTIGNHLFFYDSSVQKNSQDYFSIKEYIINE